MDRHHGSLIKREYYKTPTYHPSSPRTIVQNQHFCTGLKFYKMHCDKSQDIRKTWKHFSWEWLLRRWMEHLMCVCGCWAFKHIWMHNWLPYNVKISALWGGSTLKILIVNRYICIIRSEYFLCEWNTEFTCGKKSLAVEFKNCCI